MDYDEQARDQRRQATIADADGYWQAGDRARALRILHNSGFGPDEVLAFARERGMSEDDARTEYRASGTDWS